MSKYVNSINISVNEIVHLDLSCMLNNQLVSSEKLAMTYETFKMLYNGIRNVIAEHDAKLAQKAKAN